MNTKDNEATRYQNTENSRGIWKRAAAGAGSGLLIGGLGGTLMGMKSADPVNETDNHSENLSHPEWVDDNVTVATSVNDGMSFSEAFATARAETGPGGCFEWHGNLYGTYTAEEWNGMTAGERAEWGDHFSWNHIDRSGSDVARHNTSATTTAHHDATSRGDDSIEVVSVNHPQSEPNHTATPHAQPTQQPATDSGDIEILGVVHDHETGANFGGMRVDGQEVILIDVDGNLEFDYMTADLNGNGQLDHGEVTDIRGQGLTVDDLGGFTDQQGQMLATNDGPDYSADVTFES